MSDDELRAAAERVAHAEDDDWDRHPAGYDLEADAVAVARAWLAEHPEGGLTFFELFRQYVEVCEKYPLVAGELYRELLKRAGLINDEGGES